MIIKYLLGVGDGAGFADDGDFDLAGVGHLVLDLGGDLTREGLGLSVGHLVGTDDDSQFTTSLDGVGLGDTGIAHGDGLKVVETFDIGLYDLTTGTGTGSGDGIAHLHDGGEECLHLHLVVVGSDGIADIGLLLVDLCDLCAIEGVWHLALLVGYLTDIVEETSALGLLGVEAQFGCHDGTEIGRLTGVLQEVLTIRRTVFHLTDDTDEFGVQAMDTEVDGCALTGLDDLVVELFLDLGDHFFDACGMDTSIADELVEGQATGLAAYGIEA